MVKKIVAWNGSELVVLTIGFVLALAASRNIMGVEAVKGSLSWFDEPGVAMMEETLEPEQNIEVSQENDNEEENYAKTETKQENTNANAAQSTTAQPATEPTPTTSTKPEATKPGHVDAEGNCLPASQQVDANGNYNPTCSSPIEGVKPTASGTMIYTIGDYEQSILGTCPSQRKNSSWETGSRLPAINIIYSGEHATSVYKSLNHYIEGWWDSYKLGKWSGKHSMASLKDIAGFDNTWANSRVSFFINFDGLYVSWDNSWEDGEAINITDAQAQKLNKMASDGTNYLRSLESRYKAKCSND